MQEPLMYIISLNSFQIAKVNESEIIDLKYDDENNVFVGVFSKSIVWCFNDKNNAKKVLNELCEKELKRLEQRILFVRYKFLANKEN